ncbi:MAG: formate dehydrogenase subunit gamma [Gammaproteobacteria bacterium]|nr:formate dehydrogenase subunit gamma [Planctomycetota bacterium]MCB1747531.1 formate dehydrogenase subunit gamma [Gammaproteobacteria bacterium]MCP5200203.1 formate dehydrogenase subunit gamma [Gammaproteobacteria bacterium]
MTTEPAATGGADHDPDDDTLLDRVFDAVGERPDLLLEIFHAVQHARGYVDAALVPRIADRLNLSRADVHGALSFYPDFARTAAPRHVLKLCRAEACQSVGAVALAEHARTRLACDFHEAAADGRVLLEPVYCLGNCACAPAVMLDDELHGRVDNARLDALLDDLGSDGA